MLNATSADSLYHRVVTRYFGFGLISIFALLAATTFREFVPADSTLVRLLVTTVLPLGGLWTGCLQLRKVLATPEQILSQLAQLESNPHLDHATLTPVVDPERSAAGWNHLLQKIQSGALSSQFEERLADALRATGAEQLESVLNTLTDGIAVSDGHGQMLFANTAIRALGEIPDNDETASVSIFEVLGRMSRSRDQLPSAEALTRCRFELQRTEDADDGVFRVTCEPLMSGDPDASPETFVWTIRDVTHQKLAERMRTEFVETATHELRTPLANIRAYAETLQLQEDIPVELQKEFINIINAESTRLGRFVDELLNLSQMDAGSITISRHETDFERLLQECIEHCRPQMEAKHQTLETSIPPKLPTLHIDKDKMVACIVNLLGNAVKYTPEHGTVRLLVEATDTHLTVRVEDTGYGIAEDELPRVFNRFFRSSDERVLEESGSGLGLAYTQEIVRLHGGHLTAESELNVGSQFTLALPLS